MAHDALLAFFHPPHGHGDDFRAAGLGHRRNQTVGAVFARADEQTAFKGHAADHKGIIHIFLRQDVLMSEKGKTASTSPIGPCRPREKRKPF